MDHSRPLVDVKTLVGTRKIHCARGTGSPYIIQTKNLSCYCKACKTETTGSVKGVQGRKEEEEFWTLVMPKAERVLETVQEMQQKSETLANLYREALGKKPEEWGHMTQM